MDVSAIEEIVNHAMGQGGDAEAKHRATLLIDQLRAAPDRWSVGLKLFFEGHSELSRFFGLSLVRDFLSSAFHPSSPSPSGDLSPIHSSIREAVWAWTTSSLTQNVPIPVFILNNLVTVLTLLIKLQFPESWPSAFSDLLEVGRGCTAGLDLTVRVICDLEVEVVMFSEGRGKAEVAHNVLIKDAMRATDNSITRRIVEFLCQSAQSIRSSNVDLSERCLRCLADMVGWIDVSQVACESTLSCIYGALRDPQLCGAALCCVLELVKKGMEPIQKIQMLHAIGVAQVLALVPIGQGGQGQGGQEEGEGSEDELGPVIDVYLLELIGCWSKYEDGVFGVVLLGGKSGGNVATPQDALETQQLKELAPVISSLLHTLLPIALRLLSHSDEEGLVASTVVPSLSRLISLFKQQLPHIQAIEANRPRDGKSGFFLASDYLHPLLLAIYKQMHFEEDFGYDQSNDDDAAIIETKKEVRKLFVNCCRVHPEPCLQLISMALSALPQPLSEAAFAPLEAALRLVYSFSECGPQFNTLVNEGTFPALIQAIHATDIASHAHPQVVIAYYEICVRYIRHADSLSVRRFVTAMVDRRGLRNSNAQVRCRTAYFLFKTAEALEGKASTLLSVVGSFADVILSSPELSPSLPQSKAMLTESAELHLLEAIGLITSSTYCHWDGDAGDTLTLTETRITDNNAQNNSNNNNINNSQAQNANPLTPESALKYQQKAAEAQLQKRQRQQALEEVIRLIAGHIHSVLSHPQLARYTEEVGVYVAHKVSSLSSLAKGHSYKSRAKHPDTAFDAALSFDSAAAAAVAVAHSLGHIAVVRGKCVIFHHRMIMCMGLRSLEALGHSVPLLLSHCDGQRSEVKEGGGGASSTGEGGSEEVLQLLNQAMLEFQAGALMLVDTCLSPALKKCWALSAVLESNAYVAPSSDGEQNKGQGQVDGKKGQVEAPHFEAERVSLQKQSLVFLQHIATQQCDQALYSERNSLFLTAVFEEEILVGLQGGRGRISRAGGVPLRKAATGALTGLVKAWLSTDASSVTVPPHLSAALWSFLKEKALPTALRACTDGTSLDLRDAAAQALLVDIGALLWTLSAPTCRQEQLRGYFDEALPALGWPPNATLTLQTMLATPAPLGTFKENFKKFIRSAVIS